MPVACAAAQQAHCADRSDLLPGMYALAQCWMQQGILGSFRQGPEAVTGDQQQQRADELDLSPWFDSLTVRLVILVSQERLCEWLSQSTVGDVHVPGGTYV